VCIIFQAVLRTISDTDIWGEDIFPDMQNENARSVQCCSASCLALYLLCIRFVLGMSILSLLDPSSLLCKLLLWRMEFVYIFYRCYHFTPGYFSRCSFGLGIRGIGIRFSRNTRLFPFPQYPNRLWGPRSILSNEYRGLCPRG
jgi:hypothetical protein